MLLSIVFTDRSWWYCRDSFCVTSNRRTCTHCREYICAFTSNYAGRSNPVRRHAAFSREDQRTRRHSVLLHSLVASDVYNATFGVATPKRRGNRDSLRDFGETLGAFQQTHQRVVKRNSLVCSVIPIVSRYRSATLISRCCWPKTMESCPNRWILKKWVLREWN